jgi:O-6-methylguanine DNA methyltransferase
MAAHIDRLSTQFTAAVYRATRRIPRGRVATYGAIARAIGQPRAARAVGNALNKNPFAPRVPCHRVVRSDGTLGGFAHGSAKKCLLLEREGVRIRNGGISPNFFFKFT